MTTYAYNPRNVSPQTAKFVVRMMDEEIAGTQKVWTTVNEHAQALLDLFGQTPPQSLDQVQMLFAAAVDLGYEAGKVEILIKRRKEFINALPVAVWQTLADTGQ